MEEPKISTAEEFLWSDDEPGETIWADCVYPKMIEFAKLHVKEALEIASQKAKTKSKSRRSSGVGYTKYTTREVIDKASILNAYPKENIR